MDSFLNIDLNIYDIEKDYYRNGKKCILDPIRKILVIKTPEEIVRQKFLKYLIEELDVPKDKIDVEVPMSYFKKGSRGRADIIVYTENEDGYYIPIMIVECKAPHISLIDDVWDQVLRYNEILNTNTIVITNGNYTYGANWTDETETYKLLEELPKYNKLLDNTNFKYVCRNPEKWKRPDFKDMMSQTTIEEFLELGWLSESTDKRLYPFIINLAGFLQDETLDGSIGIDGLDIVSDGHRYTSFGNVAGGSWEGDYRYFIISDEYKNNQIISISILASLRCEGDPVFGNRRGNTTLIVSIDDFDRRHNSLQLNIDKYTSIDENIFTLWHDGTMTTGKNGAVKRKTVMDYIQNKDSSLIDSSGRIQLGTFDCRKEISWNQNSTKSFIKNLIKYAILRDELRQIIKTDPKI